MPKVKAEKISGIYKIYSELSPNLYIGSSSNIRERWYRHKKDLRRKSHHSAILQRACEKYGLENFIFEIIEECPNDALLIREQYYLDSFRPKYNIMQYSHSNLGRVERQETKDRKREINLRLNIRPPESTWMEKRISVVMMNDDKEEIQEFLSLSHACRFVGKDHTFVSCISRAIKLNTKSYGFYWKRKEQEQG